MMADVKLQQQLKKTWLSLSLFVPTSIGLIGLLYCNWQFRLRRLSVQESGYFLDKNCDEEKTQVEGTGSFLPT